MNETRNSTDNGKRAAPPQAVFKEAGEFAHDVFTLAELQTALLQVDARAAVGRLAKVAGFFVAGGVVGLSCVPVALMAVGYGLFSLGLPLPAAFAAAVAIGLLIAGLLAFVGYRMLRSSNPMFTRSKHEFQRNLTWLKQVLTRNRQSASAA